MTDIKLTDFNTYDTSNLVFSDPVKDTHGYRVHIKTKYPNGGVGPLIMQTSPLFSFGVVENTNPTTGDITGWQLPLCMHDRECPTDDQIAYTTLIDKISDICKDHCIAIRKDVKRFDLEASDLKKFNPFHYKKEEGKIVEGAGPILYAKLMYSGKRKAFVSQFYDSDTGGSIDPLTVKERYCTAVAALQIDSIYFGTKISMQIKVYETDVTMSQGGMQRLMPVRTAPDSRVRMIDANVITPLDAVKDDSEDDLDSDSDGDSPPVATKKAAVKKKAVRRTKKVAPK